jgi:methylenetetrahydrofolate dehydrogenase (NADP+)/methenyltetrahydrofolate cyclohydrolase
VATLIDGKAIGARIQEQVRLEAEELAAKGIVPGLAVVLAGDDPASQVYVRSKIKTAKILGLNSFHHLLPESTSQDELLAVVQKLNEDPAVHGILVQLPLPKQIDPRAVLEAIDPRKDVDGFHPVNVGKLSIGERDGFVPCTPAGAIELLVRSGVDTRGKDAVIVGRSNIVGKPMAALLLLDAPGGNATVTVCHSRTADLAAQTRRADILIAAIGRPEMITGDMIKPGAVVIDVGINRVNDASVPKGYRIVGDVEFASARAVASLITPVPGGVGPMTIAMLMKNTVRAAAQIAGV